MKKKKKTEKEKIEKIRKEEESGNQTSREPHRKEILKGYGCI